MQNMSVIFNERIKVDGIGRYAEFILDLVQKVQKKVA